MKIKNKNQWISYLLAVVMLLALMNSAYFFLVIAKFRFFDWLAFNACSVSIVAYLVCFVCSRLFKKDFFEAIALVPLYYYGTMGLFVMPWNVMNMFAQVTHMVITLNVIWIIYVFLKELKFKSLGIGLLIGMLIFVPVFAIIQSYVQIHMSEFVLLLQKTQ